MPVVDDGSSGRMMKEAASSDSGCFVGANTRILVKLGPHILDEADEEADEAAAETAAGVDEANNQEAGGEEIECTLPEHLRVNYVCQVTKDARDAMAKYDCSGREVLMFCSILFLGSVSLGLTIGLIQSSSKLESGHYLLHACKDLRSEYRRLLDGYDRNVSTETTRKLEEQLATDKDYVMLRLGEGPSAASAAASAQPPTAVDGSGDAGVDPCADLHGHACGAAWAAANPTPDFRRRGGGAGWSAYDAVEYRTKLAVHGDLLAEATTAGDRRLRRLHRRCLRWRAGRLSEARPWAALASLTGVSAATASPEGLFGLAHLRLRLDTFVSLYDAPALVDSSAAGLYLDIRVTQPPLPLRTVLSICRTFRLCELPHCSSELTAIDRVERVYSTILSTNRSAQFSDPLDSRAEPITVEELERHLPQLRWGTIFDGDPRRLHLYADKSFIRLLGELMRRVDRSDLRTFLLWSMARSLYQFVSRAAQNEMASIQRAPDTPDWLWCLDHMPVGPLALELQASQLGRQLNGRRHLVLLLGRRVRDQWLKKLIQTGISIDSRVLDKIQRIDIGQHVGLTAASPMQRLGRGSNASFFEDVLQLLLLMPADNSQDFSQLQVNAFYNRQLNSIQVSMANFQPPFFSPDGPDYLNFAGMAAVLGHEIFHSIDSIGRAFGANGSRLDLLGQRSLVVEPALAKLCSDQLVGCQLDQLDELSDESLADQFGLVMALSAFRETLQHLHGQEILLQTRRFFMAFARSNCGYDEAGAASASYEAAYPSWKDRVNKPVQQLREFYQAFNCSTA